MKKAEAAKAEVPAEKSKEEPKVEETSADSSTEKIPE